MEDKRILELNKMKSQDTCIVCGADSSTDVIKFNDIYDNEQDVCIKCFVKGLRHINETNKVGTLFNINEYERCTQNLIKDITIRKTVGESVAKKEAINMDCQEV